MTVITNSLLLVRRIGELHRRRQQLAERQDQLRQALPDWALEPLRLVGVSAAEVQELVGDLSQAEEEVGLGEIDDQIERLDEEIEELERLLLCTRAQSLDGIEALLSLAVARLGAFTVTDPADVFYDHGEARALALLERTLGDLQALLQQDSRQVG
jgi:hypothetical protein